MVSAGSWIALSKIVKDVNGVKASGLSKEETNVEKDLYYVIN